MKKIIVLLTGILLISLYSGRLVAQAPGYPYSNSKNMDVDSVRIHYRVWEPVGQPRGKVILVHGFAGSTFNFRNNVNALVDAGYKVVAIDLPGFGYSARNDNLNQSQSNRSRLIWMLLHEIDGNDTTRWNLVGHSMGGGAVEAMAMMHPERTRSLTIIDGMLISKGASFYQSFFSLGNSHKRNEFLANYTKKNLITYKNFEKKLKTIYGFVPDSATVYEYLIPLALPGSEHTIVNLVANAGEIAPLNKRSLDSVPILVVWGKKDKTIPLSNGKHFVKETSSAQLKIVPDAYHSPNETHPAIFNNWLIEFLNKNNSLPISASIP